MINLTIFRFLETTNHVFALMVFLIIKMRIQIKIFAYHVLMVVKPVMVEDMINVLLVNLIQIYLFIINNKAKINVFWHVQQDILDTIKLINVRNAISHACLVPLLLYVLHVIPKVNWLVMLVYQKKIKTLIIQKF